MIVFTKQDMYYNDYSWTNYLPNHPKVSGKLDNTKFNCDEGNEVLYLIQKIIELWDFTKIESCIKIERIIKEKLPNNITNQEEAVTWIQINWRSIQFKEVI
jgi:ABC-type uncharacterized transport system YnjBCD substrate-binding protein